MRVSVLGLGYVGCVTAACLAEDGHDVLGVDISPDKVAMINAARSPIVEPGLAELLTQVVVGTGSLRATSFSREAIVWADVSLVCVGTPSRDNGQLDTTAIERVGEEIGRALAEAPKDHTVALRSTVLPGTVEKVFVPAIELGLGRPLPPGVSISVNPEFMREGSSLQDFRTPPLTLVGCGAVEAADLLRVLYRGIQAPFVHTSVRTAEMVKYVANAFHALKVSFANEIGDVCAALGADPHDVMRIFSLDRKLNISEAYLRPGFAFGGSCLPKDLRALLHAARTADLALPLISTILPSNETQIRRGVEAVLRTRKRRVGIVGLAFKPGTDDLRESPMVLLAEALVGKGCLLRILDRNVAIAHLVGYNRRFIESEIPDIASLMCDDPDTLLTHAEVIVIGSPSDEASAVLRAVRKDQVVVDLTRGPRPPCPAGATPGLDAGGPRGGVDPAA